MCIRDRGCAGLARDQFKRGRGPGRLLVTGGVHGGDEEGTCLLYTSDAADERSSVDLGGRRLIKKKT